MLHEILLSLSGHPSPLLTADHTSSSSILSPSERSLLSSVAHLSDLHCRLLAHTNTISSKHSSSICKAVATSISSVHLVSFQRKVLEVENGILRKDSGSVGAYNIVPLTFIVEKFSGWTRRMEWFLEIVDFMMQDVGGKKCSGAMVIDKLCNAIQTGYADIEEAALSLVKVAQTAWLKQVSAWILYGRLPSFGRGDFFVQEDDSEDYKTNKDLLPAFVSDSTASSLLFIGRSLNHIRVKGISSASSPELDLLSSHLRQLSTLQFPINGANFARVIAAIRLSLSQTTLQKLLPLSKVIEVLTLLREFFLLGRGEFAIALISEADEKIRSRWRRSGNSGYEKKEGLGNIVVKEGEVSAVLARTWAAMGAQQGQNDEEDDDDLLELARDLVQLSITMGNPNTQGKASLRASQSSVIVSTPFRNLLLSIPVALTMHIPSPLDLFLTSSDIQMYSSINAYLLAVHRAHLRLTNLWKITSLRRDHPAPPGPPFGSSTFGRKNVLTLRSRAKERSHAMRSVWATSSAAVFFLGETEAYLQGEVVQGTWLGFTAWLTGETQASTSQDEDDIWLQAAKQSTSRNTSHNHDPQTLADAHRRYLAALASNLLLNTSTFTNPLYYLLQQIDHLVALVHRIHSIWQSLDLEADEGVVDAFSDFHKEEQDIKEQLVTVARRVKDAIEELVKTLRDIDQDKNGWDSGYEELVLGEEGAYVPAKVGRVDRLLMKLDFGGWFDKRGNEETGDVFDDLGDYD
ncbi:eb17ea33-38ad-4dd5-8356-22cb5b1aadab [Sclerotinia trifoliorum]|uniref:Spindle pole body component n=1 Tax=Sclerotinia trifoliorum TaxID=28548 RepID=A0A8H2W0R7_9HELO|nr:eb17ea33-38ad-4dd5-8356-22cb5b1aadab [Sclerotinia trifoliorum]